MQACVMCVCTDVCMHVCAPRVRGCERARTHTHSRHKPVRAQLPVSEPRGETGSPECGGGGGRYQRGQAWLGPTQSGTLGAPEHGKDTALPTNLEPWPGARCASGQGHQGALFPRACRPAGASTRVNLPPPPNHGD